MPTVAYSTPTAPDATCPAGGQRIDYGIDENGNGTLDPDEIDGSATICNGVDIGALLYAFSPAPAGANCAYGGTRIDMGFDDGSNGGTASDGVLQSGEIRRTDWLCGSGSGVSEGAVGAPVDLTAGALHHGKVAAASTSYYRFTGSLDWDHRIGLTRTDSDLSWALYSNAAFTTAIASCDAYQGQDGDESCKTPILTSGTAYYLKVEERSNIPNLFDVRVDEDAVLVAADFYGEISQVNPETAYTSFWMETGLWQIDAMAFDPSSGSLLAGFTSDTIVYEIDPRTGATSVVVASADTFAGMAVRPSDGAIFATRQSECDDIYEVDPGAGSATPVLNLNVAPYYLCGSSSGITFDGSDLAYFTSDTSLFWADLDGGTFDLAGTVDLSSFSGATAILSMASRPTDGRVFIVTDSAELGWLDIDSMLATPIGTLHTNLDGLAFIGTSGKLPPPAVADLQGVNSVGDEIEWTWRPYPAASGFKIYWKGGVDQARPMLIDPDNPATYDGVVDAPAGVSFTRDFAAEAAAGCAAFASVSAVARPVVGGVELAKDSSIDLSYMGNCF